MIHMTRYYSSTIAIYVMTACSKQITSDDREGAGCNPSAHRAGGEGVPRKGISLCARFEKLHMIAAVRDSLFLYAD